MNLRTFKKLANDYGLQGRPFFFLLDFELQKPVCIALDELTEHEIFFSLPNINMMPEITANNAPSTLVLNPIDLNKYREAFDLMQKHLHAGDTYLINLTFPTCIGLNLKLIDVFKRSKALYKLLYKDQFTLFSPECFVRTHEGYIYSYPMKGTIDANLPNAVNTILSNKKEIWEHNTIVDLIRNDLAIVSKNIEVTKFRYLSKIHSKRMDLLQVSSEIRGELSKDWTHRIGDILCSMLPAGSISGAPKKRTVEIIAKAEKQDRGYFTGVFGVFDGKELDSAVNIRYIEHTTAGLQFRSGGGITAMSQLNDEYQEMVNKVYVPLS